MTKSRRAPLRPRVYIVGATKRHVGEVQRVFRQLRETRGLRVETKTFVGFDGLLPHLERYVNLVIFNFRGIDPADFKSAFRDFRATYSGRMVLVNEDPSVHPCIWGRFYGVNYQTATAEELQPYIERTLGQTPARGRTAIVFAGGGILGGFTEIGVYSALHDMGLRDFDMYIGLSAGAHVAAIAAHRIPPRVMVGEGGLGLLDFYSPNVRDIVSKSVRFVPNLLQGALDYLKHERRDLLFLLSSLLPSSFLTGKRISRSLKRAIFNAGGTNNFRDLRDRGTELYVTAMDLDTTELRVFGAEDDLDVPISLAVRASGALPLAYRPVNIDGRQYIDGGIHTTANIDVAIEQGADLIVCVNPLVPFVADEVGTIQRMGPLGVAEQSYRTMLHRRLHRDLQFYRMAHPRRMILLIEPDLRNQSLFHNPLNANSALITQAVAEGYDSVRRFMERDWDFVERSFLYHGRPISRTVMDRVSTALRHRRLSHNELMEVFADEAEA